MASRKKAFEETDKLTRIAIVNSDKCKPKRCRQECKKSCPVVRMGKLCIEVSPTDRIATISETLCIGCGICIKVCMLSSPICFQLWICFIIFLFRNVHLKRSPLSIFPATWTKILLIDTPRILSSSTDCQLLVLVHHSFQLPYFYFTYVYYSLELLLAGEVLGLVGTNGIGKSTALKILAGKLKPNLGRFSVTFLSEQLYWLSS